MQQTKWITRKFTFDHQENIFPSIIERLEGTPIRLQHKIKMIPEEIQSKRLDGTWSIKENIGHLIDLEELWQGRLEDILEGKEYMRVWDVTNQQTFDAQHNEKSIEELTAKFEEVRTHTILSLQALEEADIFKQALHPRLEIPMRMMDLFLFVAEHDYHHLARITYLQKTF